jgi:hypothetical protein
MPAFIPARARLLWLAAATFALAAITSGEAPGARAANLPEFRNASPEAWINSPPLTTAALRGKVVLIEVYTSG